jgi:hypothetical protein
VLISDGMIDDLCKQVKKGEMLGGWYKTLTVIALAMMYTALERNCKIRPLQMPEVSKIQV